MLAQAVHLDPPAGTVRAAEAGGARNTAGEREQAPPGLRVVVVDDQALVRTGLRVVLDSEPGFELVGEAENGEQAIAPRRRPPPTWC